MSLPIKIEKIKETSYGCPSQWDMYTNDGKYVFVHYRNGVLLIKYENTVIYHKQLSDDNDGVMSLDELSIYTYGILDFSQESEELIPA